MTTTAPPSHRPALLCGILIGCMIGALAVLMAGPRSGAAIHTASVPASGPQRLNPVGPPVPQSTRLYGPWSFEMMEQIRNFFVHGRNPKTAQELHMLLPDQIAVWSFDSYAGVRLGPSMVFQVSELLELVGLEDEGHLSARGLMDRIVATNRNWDAYTSHPSGIVLYAEDADGVTLLAIEMLTIGPLEAIDPTDVWSLVTHMAREYQQRATTP